MRNWTNTNRHSRENDGFKGLNYVVPAERGCCVNQKTFLRLVLTAACFVFAAGQLSLAQSTAQTPKGLLFRGRPLPACKSFFIYEAAFLHALNSPFSAQDYSWEKEAATLDAGVMWNLSPKAAIGGVGHLSFDGMRNRVAVLVRYRRWMSEMPSGSGTRPLRVDIDAGLVVRTFDASISNQAPNFSSGIGLNLEDLLVLTIRYETYRTRQYTYFEYSGLPGASQNNQSRTNGTFYVGVKGGSYIGAAASIAAVAVVAAIIIAYPEGFD